MASDEKRDSLDSERQQQFPDEKMLGVVDYDESDKTDESPRTAGKCLTFLKTNLILILMIVFMLLGIGLGAGLREMDPPLTEREILYLRFPGELMLNMLKMLILPLVISSLISGMASLDMRSSGRMGLRAVTYYMVTTFLAVVLGIILVLVIQPGYKGGGEMKKASTVEYVNGVDSFLDLVRNMFPDNLVQACFAKAVTEQIKKNESVLVNITHTDDFGNISITENTTYLVTYSPNISKTSGMNILGLVVFSLFFGAIISRMRERGLPIKQFFDSLNEAVMVLITLVIWYSPIGVMFLIAAKVAEMEDPGQVLEQLGFYILTVLAGLIIHGYVVLPIIYLITVRKNPFIFIYNMIQAIVTAFATASSSATLPVTMRCLEEKNRIDGRVIRFITPIGATINMDGTALYEAVASIFIAQITGFPLDAGSVITISVTATLAAIGAAGVPQAGVVTMLIVLSAVGLPTDGIEYILAIDWFLDRCRTSVNVLGDALGAGIVFKLSTKDLELMDSLQEEERRLMNDDLDGREHVNGGINNTGFETDETIKSKRLEAATDQTTTVF